MSVTVLRTSEWTAETSDAKRETLRRAVMGKSSSAQDSITSSKAGGPLPPSTKLPCADAQVKTFDATARACSYAGYGTKAIGRWLQNLVL